MSSKLMNDETKKQENDMNAKTEIPVVRRPDGVRQDARGYEITIADVGKWVIIQSGCCALVMRLSRYEVVAAYEAWFGGDNADLDDLVEVGQVDDGDCFLAEVEAGTEEDCE